jgi:hypothetical protein
MKLIQRLLLFGCASAMLCSLGVHIALCQTPDVVPNRVTQAVDDTVRVTLKGNVHPLARAEFSRGPVPDNLAMDRILLVLRHSDSQEAALQSLLEAQQDKSSSNYHQWLTPDKFGTQFGLSEADLQVVTDWLNAQGFASVRVGAGRNVIEFSGSAGQVKKAFGTAIQNYQVNGAMYVANASDPQIPSALAPVLTGIVSLHNFPRKSHAKYLGVARKGRNSSRLQPLFTFPDPSTGNNFYGVGPGDFAKIYNSQPLIAAGTDGTGETIAIVGETEINPQDVSDFRTMFGLSNNFSASNIVLNGMDPGVTSQEEESESDLDVQWSGAVAPGATVKFVVSASTPSSAGIDLSALYIVEHNLADVMSESYGDCESDLGTAGNAFYNSLWEQAAAQGISVAVSSGDGGSAGCDDFHAQPPVPATHGIAVSGLSGTPFNVSVGGTDFNQGNVWSTYWNATNDSATGTSAKGYIPEIPWNENCAQLGLSGCGASAPQGSVNIVAGSGGPSRVYAKPKWQMGVSGMPNDNHRDQPDISLFASSGFTGSAYIYCQSDRGGTPCSLNNSGSTFYLVGGTSAAAPAFAGIMSLVNQYTAAHGGSSRQGNPNYVLYALAKKSGASCASSSTEATSCIFNDVVAGNNFLATKYGMSVGSNSVPCNGGTANCSSAAGTIGVMVDPNKTSTEAWTAAAGYDLATGLGSLNVDNLAMSWGSASAIATTTSLTISPTTGITHGTNENVAVTVNVKPNTGTGIASGDVALLATMSDGSTLGVDQFTLSNGSVASVKTQSLPGGTYKLYAHYAGDGTNAPSDSASVQVSVAKESSQTFVNLVTYDINGNPTSFNATSSAYGAGFALLRADVGDASATVSSTTGISSACSKGTTNCPSGTVSLNSSGATLGLSALALNNLGYAIYQPLAPGSYSLAASYPGDASYSPSSTSTNFSISKATTVATAAVAGTPVQYGESSQIVAQIATTSTGVAPTGTFQFYVDGNPAGGPTSVYESNHYFPGGTPPNYAWADASSSTAFPSVGNHALYATYSGDANYAASTSPTMTVNVTKYLPFIGSFGANPATTMVNQPVALFVQMYGSIATPTGAFSFTVDNKPVTGTVTLTPTGNSGVYASISYTPNTVGNHALNASYAGDSNYLPTSTPTSANLTVIGPDFTLTPQTTSAMVVAGNPAEYNVAIAGTDGFNGMVSVICSLPAADSTCSAMPASVVSGSTTTITVTTTAHQMIPPVPISSPLRPELRVWPLTALVVLTVILLPFFRTAPQRRLAMGALFAGLIISVALLEAGCGGGGSSGGPPPIFGTQTGNYIVTITATSGSTTHATTVSLTVR